MLSVFGLSGPKLRKISYLYRNPPQLLCFRPVLEGLPETQYIYGHVCLLCNGL